MQTFDPQSAEFIRDPYSTYAALRARAPVHFSDVVRGWVLTRYCDVDTALRDHAHLSSNLTLDPLVPESRRNVDMRSMVVMDPPDHTRLRSLVNKAFTPRAIQDLRPRIEQIATDLLDARKGQGTIDIMADLAMPLPMIVIAEMLGVAIADRARFKQWTMALIRTFESNQDEQVHAEGMEAIRQFIGFFEGVIEERRRAPGQDLVTELIAVEDAGERLNAKETLAMLRLLLVAGYETTTNLIGNGLLALLRNPAQMALLRQRPALMTSAVEELLRYDAPVQFLRRIAIHPCRIGDTEIQPGQRVLTVIGAANRDPGQFAAPDRLDIERAPNRHLAFGRGIHHCLGAALARLEASVVFAQLLARFPHMELAGEPSYRPHMMVRGLETLPVRVA